MSAMCASVAFRTSFKETKSSFEKEKALLQSNFFPAKKNTKEKFGRKNFTLQRKEVLLEIFNLWPLKKFTQLFREKLP
jgi:hypothetical protein